MLVRVARLQSLLSLESGKWRRSAVSDLAVVQAPQSD
jgi:hypothetical protein